MGNILKDYKRYIDAITGFPGHYDFCDKERNISQMIGYMLDRTQSMFRWEGLPESIPQRIVELYLQLNGNVCFYEYNGTLYAFCGGMGGEPDVYYMPTVYTIANPALKLSVNARINENCIVIPNDSMYMGLYPMFLKYATSMVETELSIDIASVNSRIVDLISAPDDRTRESALIFLRDLRDGKPGVIAENAFLDGMRAQPYGNTGNRSITDLIELNQYQKASLFNELGLNANYNMKRESLNSAESQLNNDALLPLVDDMLRMRKDGADRLNKMFGLDVFVDLASAWEDNQQELESEQDMIEGTNSNESEGETDDEPKTPNE